MIRRQFLRHTGSPAIAATILLLATPLTRSWLEAAMSTHMLLQMPLLAALGFMACRQLPATRQKTLLSVLGGPAACVLIATFSSSYWMLPRTLDAALSEPAMEAAKFLTLPLLVGLPLALAWRQLGLIGRGFVWTNFISMLAVVGWLYIAAPLRVCNNYLVDDQSRTGWLMVKLAVSLFAGWLGALFFSDRKRIGTHGRTDQTSGDALPVWPTLHAG